MNYVDYSMTEDGSDGFRRLSGLTNFVGGNPNGLAKAVAITFPIIFFLYKYYKLAIVRILFICYFFASVICLVLTGSRSGLIATIVGVFICLVKSKFLVIGTTIMLLIATSIWFNLDYTKQQRFSSTVDSTADGRAGAIGRLIHIKNSAIMFTKKPIFGHGLGSFIEANWKYNREWLVSHSFYTGVLVELGVIGFILYFSFIFSIFNNISMTKQRLEKDNDSDPYLMVIADILSAVLIIQLVFSIFAGGPIAHYWFLYAGISIALVNIFNSSNKDVSDMKPGKFEMKKIGV